MAEIGLVEVSGAVRRPTGGVPVAFDPEDADRLTLRFLLSHEGESGLEAVREARRALIREEWTRGREAGEPSLEDAVFSATEILWEVRADQRDECVRKLEELRTRANRLLTLQSPSER